MSGTTPDQVRAAVREYILVELLPGADASELTDITPLIDGGILDSLATIKLVAVLEERYGIRIEPHEAGIAHFNTVDDISRLVSAKLGG